MTLPRKVQRTLKRAVDLERMATISSDDLIAMHADDYQQLRRNATRARLTRTARYVCECCGHSVYAPRARFTGQPMWRHAHGAPAHCPWWTGETMSVDAASAAQFAGLQESPLHERLKNLVAEMLSRDSQTEPGSVVVDRYVLAGVGRRRPDVLATYAGIKTVFEIQLATTQIPIIVAREDFYEAEGMRLVWLTWNFEPPGANGRLKSSIEDISHSHGKCIFSVDPETLRLAEGSGTMTVKAFRNDAGWSSRALGLPALSWLPSGRATVPPPALSWQPEFLVRWRSAVTELGMPHDERRAFFEELAGHVGREDITVRVMEDADAEDLINCVLSVMDGRPIASRQKNLHELLNTFLMVPRRHRLAQLMTAVCTRSNRTDLLAVPSVALKVREAMKTTQDTRASIAGRIVLAVFPGLFEGSSSGGDHRPSPTMMP